MFQPYRTSPLVMPGPRTINEVGVGAPTFQPHRGPQYWTGSMDGVSCWREGGEEEEEEKEEEEEEEGEEEGEVE